MSIRENQIKVSKEDLLFNLLKENFLFIKNDDGCINLIKEKRILVNDKEVKENFLLKKENIISILSSKEDEPKINENFEIIYEDEFLFAINKPPHLPVHPAGKYFFNTLTNLIKEKTNISEFYPVNRLDKETSGIVLFAKDKDTAKLLGEMFLRKEVKKQYLAVCFGEIKVDKFLIDKPLLKKEYEGIRNHIIVDKNGKESLTEVELIFTNKEFSLVKVFPITGRSHQIRVHLSSIGNPIVGDKEYGTDLEIFKEYYLTGDLTKAKKILLSENQLLHCEIIKFIHPKNNFELEIKAKIPENMQKFINEKLY